MASRGRLPRKRRVCRCVLGCTELRKFVKTERDLVVETVWWDRIHLLGLVLFILFIYLFFASSSATQSYNSSLAAMKAATRPIISTSGYKKEKGALAPSPVLPHQVHHWPAHVEGSRLFMRAPRRGLFRFLTSYSAPIGLFVFVFWLFFQDMPHFAVLLLQF